MKTTQPSGTGAAVPNLRLQRASTLLGRPSLQRTQTDLLREHIRELSLTSQRRTTAASERTSRGSSAADDVQEEESSSASSGAEYDTDLEDAGNFC